MDITSAGFLILVAVSLLIYWNIPAKYQWYILLIDSIIFYLFSLSPYTFVYLLLSVASIYIGSRYFEKPQKSDQKKKICLIVVICFNLLILAVLKYSNLFIQTANYFRTGETQLAFLHLAAPLAISFYTLQAIAYLLDCYWGQIKAEKNLLKLLLFICYFPLMNSGPISRYSQLGTQLIQEHAFDYQRTVSGLRRIFWGIIKKVIIANRLTYLVNFLFNNYETFDGIWIWAGVVLFSIELYFDFSGCMDIVIGASKCFGIILEENFLAPFFSRTIQEFWQRWHITLGKWLKDYIMNPILKSHRFVQLGKNCKKRWGKKGKKIPAYIAMFVLWSAMGMWHGGDSWKYIIGEGWWFWLVIVLGQSLEPAFEKAKNTLHIKEENAIWILFQRLRTLLVFSTGMIFFRAKNLETAWDMLRNSFRFQGNLGLFNDFLSSENWRFFGQKEFVPFFLIIVIAQLVYDYHIYTGKEIKVAKLFDKTWLRWIVYCIGLGMIAYWGDFGQSVFIYGGF